MTRRTGNWLFKTTHTLGAPEFMQVWRASVRKHVVFDYSGYVLGNYVDAQRAVNGVVLVDEQADVARNLAKAFIAAFVFDTVVPLPELPDEPLRAHCTDAYGAEGQELLEPITAAHAFFERGLLEITPESLVVFVIS